jgi:hypothetical protein
MVRGKGASEARVRFAARQGPPARAQPVCAAAVRGCTALPPMKKRRRERLRLVSMLIRVAVVDGDQ